VKLLRKIIALVVGVICHYALAFAMAKITITNEPTLLLNLVKGSILMFIVGIVAGYIARTKGWLYGLLIGIIMTALTLIKFFWSHPLPFSIAITTFVGIWLVNLPQLLIGTLGGHLGQLLVQKRHSIH